MKPFKLFQYDKKVWDYGDTDRTWQFGILKNRSFLWLNYQTPSETVDTHGAFHIQISFFASSLFGITLGTNKTSLSFYFFTEYFPGWN